MRILVGVIFFTFFINIFLIANNTKQNSSIEEDSSQLVRQLNLSGSEAYDSGEFESAIEYFTKSLSISKKLYGEGGIRTIVPLLNLGVISKTLGEYEKAIDNYLSVEKLIIDHYQTDNHPRLGFVYTNLGNVYKLQGDYIKSFEFQKAALRAYMNDSVRYKSQIDNVVYTVAEAHFLLNEYDKAIEISYNNIPKVDDEDKSYYYGLLAGIYNKQKKFDLADRYFLKTLEIIRSAYGTDDYGLGMEYNNYSSFLLETGEFAEALNYNHEAERIIKKYFTDKSIEYSKVMTNYADYYFLRSSEASGIQDFHFKRMQDLEKAQSYYKRAILSATEGFTSDDIYTLPTVQQSISETQLLEITKKKAQCFESLADLNMSVFNQTEALKNYHAALASVELATDLIHQIRTGFVSEDSRFFLAENQDETFIEAVNICYKLYTLTGDQKYAEKGFELTEKSKSASFLTAVKDSKAKEFGGVPDSLLNREDVLKFQISSFREDLFEENRKDKPDSAKLARFNAKIFQLNEDYQQLIQHLEDSFPNYYSFKYENKVVDIEEVRRNISDREAVVEYLVQEPTNEKPSGKLFKFIITQDELHFVQDQLEMSYVQDIEYLYGFLSSPNYLSTGLEEYKGYVKSAHNLYSTLLGSDNEVIEGKKLIVVPDDKLSYIPFDAMLSQESDTTRLNFRKLPYLVKDYPISYTYSATLLFNYFENEKEAKKDVLAFAPIYNNGNMLGSETENERDQLMPIPAVDQEVKSIEDFVSADVFKDSMAQEKVFKNLASEYDILHLAMHTIINDTLPMFSKLAFSSPNKGDFEDGWLNTNEIYTMDLKARMAVLSACNTGSGKLQKGEGVMSLARGFLYAGCPSIVMTLWEVEDESGATIMGNFYRLLSKGKSKNEALRLAKLEHIESADPLKAHPHYWLGYVAVGNPDPLYFSKDIYFILVIFGLIILLIADQLYRKKKSRS